MSGKIKDWLTLRRLAIVLLTLVGVIGFTGYMASLEVWFFVKPIQTLLEDFYANVSAELGSILLTILVIDALNEKRIREQEKRRLILQMGSPGNAFAVEAVRILKVEGWLEDGSLKGAFLWKANLAGANLADANLAGADLERANLVGAILADTNLKGTVLQYANLEGTALQYANLTGAVLRLANLKGAVLQLANLEGAVLQLANLEGVDLRWSNLEGADLWGANLKGANLQAANLERAILPDGTELPGRTPLERREGKPGLDWHTLLEAWDKAGRPRIEPTGEESEGDEQPLCR